MNLPIGSENFSAAQLKAVLDTVVDGIITIDESGRIATANPAAQRIFQYERDEMLGRNVKMLMPQPYADEHDGYLLRYLTTGEKRIIGIGREVTGLRKDGTVFPMELAVGEMQIDGVRLFNGIVRDITERKRVEQALIAAKTSAELANRTKDSFLATMSHEIRTPLGGLLGMLELLGFTPLNKDQNEALQAARDSGRGLLRILNDILDWSKIEAGKLDVSPQPTSIRDLVTGVVDTYSRVASAQSLVLGQDLDERIGAAHLVDPLRLSQILNNFVSNALKFTPKGWVRVRAELLDRDDGAERIRFSVVDTGIGISKATQELLFEAYQQKNSDTARLHGGTGLGLAICRRLAAMLDGEISLQSAVGMGSTFSVVVTLPIVDAALVEARRKQRTPGFVAQHMRNGVTDSSPIVLVVDDHPTNRKLLAIQLGLLGLRTELADSGRSALALWQHKHFDLVITDCHMPEMDGLELARTIRAAEFARTLPRTPIFAWTANALADEAEASIDAGMDEVLIKPIEVAELHQALLKWQLATDSRIVSTDWPPLSGDAPARTAAVDTTVLEKAVGNNPELIGELLREFRHSAARIASDLRTACQAGDTSAVKHAAHRLKSPARSIGASALSALCDQMEAHCRAGHGETAFNLLQEFEIELAAVNQQLDKW